MTLFQIKKKKMVIQDMKEASSLLDAMTDFAKENGIPLNDLQCYHSISTSRDPDLDNNNYSPLFFFSVAPYEHHGDLNEEYRWDLILELAQRGFDLNQVRANEGLTMHYACSIGRWDKVMELIKVGANINVQDKFGNTSLNWHLKVLDVIDDQSAWDLKMENVKELIKLGVDPRIKNNQGETAYDIAKNTYSINCTDFPDYLKEVSLILDEKEALEAASQIAKRSGSNDQSIISSVPPSTTVRL